MAPVVKVFFNTPHSNTTTNLQNFVGMSSDQNSAVTFHYGHVASLQGTNSEVEDGSLSPGSGFKAGRSSAA